MSNTEFELRVQELAKVGMMPYAAFENRYQHDGIGAALVVRAALYFKSGFSPEKRSAIAHIFEAYLKIAKAAKGEMGSVPLKWLWFNGKRALPLSTAPSLSALRHDVGENEAFDATYVGGEAARDASLYEFTTFCLEKWQSELGTRGLDTLVFTLPVPFVRSTPEAFTSLFQDAATKLDAIHGHAGLAVNLSPTGREENESSEYFMAQQLGPGVDVGDPLAMKVADLVNQIKTIDWLTLIDATMLSKVGGIDRLRSELPPDWYSVAPCAQGVMIRAGVLPQAGVRDRDGDTAAPPPAYIVLNAALRALIPDSISILQQGAVNGEAPVYNSKTSSNAWLRRFDVSAEQLLAAKAAVLDTPRLPSP
ncbi:type VI immunity family protein [Burkholderia gladioli]|uniref:type VI immunity family protein n=1 Tax=Burkholderia gladioli TaxID=28095 RepID=UPI00164075E2|nr:type VI immunity family protein [Burkholderia gladioli]